MKHDPRDPQRDLLYEWERDEVEARTFRETMGVDEMQATVAAACAWLGIREARVVPRRGLPVPCRAVPSDWAVEVADWGRNTTTLLHEVAHLATLPAIGRGEAPHGPTFLGTAMTLYAKYLGVPIGPMRDSARRKGLAFAAPVAPAAAGRPPVGDGDLFEGEF